MSAHISPLFTLSHKTLTAQLTKPRAHGFPVDHWFAWYYSIGRVCSCRWSPLAFAPPCVPYCPAAVGFVNRAVSGMFSQLFEITTVIMKVWYEMVGGNCGSRHHRRDHDNDHQHVTRRSRDHDDHHGPHQYFFAKVHRPSPFGHPEHPSGHGMGHGFVQTVHYNFDENWLNSIKRLNSTLSPLHVKYL